MPDADLSSRWLWLLPRLAFGLFVASVAAQLWLSGRTESEAERATLLSDMLWLEQTLRFNLQHNEENLAQIDPGRVRTAALFEAHARPLLANNTGLRQVLLLGPDDRQVRSLPGHAATLSATTLNAARRLGKAGYSPPYRGPSGEWLFQVHVPLFHEGRYAGATVGVYDLRKILQEAVPWWLAQRNQIGVVDIAGQPLAIRSQVTGQQAAASHRLFFDPPGHGLVLWATPIRTPPALPAKLLPASLVLLAILVIWSLWALRRDMRQRLAAEQALRDQHALRQAMENSLQTGLRARDLDGRITYVNPAFCRMVGWSAKELLGQSPPMPYWTDDDIDSTRALCDRILAGEGPKQGFEIRFRRRNGEIFWALVHEAPLMDIQGRQTGWMSSIIDITPQKQAEELARQQQERLQVTARLVSMGEMASSLAHELNQPLAAISSYAAGSLNLLDNGLARPEEIRDILAKTQAQAQRAGRVLRRIYDFGRRADPKSEPCDPVELTHEIADLVEVDARRQKVRLLRDIPADLPEVVGDRILLGQALLNLMRNGIEAMHDSPEPRRILNVRLTVEADQLRLRVADHGPGIAPAMLPRLFEPFYTSKPEGLGMGLNICRSIVEAHRGRLWMEPNPEGGSIFNISLPIKTA